MDINLLVHGSRRYLATPQGFGNVLYTAHRDTGRVHFDEGFLYAALPAAIPPDDGRFKRDAFKTGYMECDISGGGGKVPVMVAVAVALASLAALIAGSLRQFLRLLRQQFIQCFFDAAPDQFFELTRDYLLVQLYNLLGHGLQTLFRMVYRNFILPEFCKPCLFLSYFQFAQLIVLYPFL